LIQRALSIAFSLAAVALSAVLAVKSAPPLPGSEATAAASESPRTQSRDAGVVGADAGSASLEIDAALPTVAELALPTDIPPSDLHLADGTPVPALGKGAPRHVRFGVALVTYEGAEGAPDKGARRRADALALATKLADEGQSDFHASVQRGDPGSSDDVGEVTRGVLEPGSEAVLFALPVGGVSGVIDTPRGFWIVKRLE
jgi:hypothetical protein